MSLLLIFNCQWEVTWNFIHLYCMGDNSVFPVVIWRVQKRYPQYGIPIWCLWPNIRFLPSTVTQKNATKNPHIVGSVFEPIEFLLPVCRLLIFIHIEHICSFFVAFFSSNIDGRNLIFGHILQSRQTGRRNLMGPKTLPTIWGTYMKLVTKYQISAINSCWLVLDQYRFD
jgi:hypothetical protein